MNTRIDQHHQWEIPERHRAEFMAIVNKANRRLERAGVLSQFSFTYTDFNKLVTLPSGIVAHETWVRATLDGPLSLTLGDYTFVASLVPEEAGVTVHTAPGEELGGYVPVGDSHCDHCGIDRYRTRLYLVRDNHDGRILQLGHTCIEAYTGLSPKGLWALTFDSDLDTFVSELSEGFGGGYASYSVGVDTVLAYSWVHSDHGRGYVPTSRYEDGPTIDRIRTSLFTNLETLRSDRDHNATYYHYQAVAEEANKVRHDADLLAAIRASAETLSEDSDYGRNMRVILAGEMVSPRNMGILASLVSVYARQLAREAEHKASAAVSGFIGEVGERVKDLHLTLTTVRSWETQFGVTTMIVGRTDDGHVVVWKASKGLDVDSGDVLDISAATVKEHGEFNGVDQTVITRARVA